MCPHGEDRKAPSARPGVVLAGGYSRRFGDQDKALAKLNETPMLRVVVERLAGVLDSVVVSCRSEQRPEFEAVLDGCEVRVSFAVDPTPDGGPLVGLRHALERVSGEYTAVVACDMPLVDPAFVEYLFSRADGRDGAVPVDRDGTRQPTQAVYRTAAAQTACTAALEAGVGRLTDAVSRLDAVELSYTEVADQTSWHSFTDVNTPAAYDRVSDRLG